MAAARKPIVQQNVSLKPYNTFGLDVSAADFVAIENVADLRTTLTDLRWRDKQKLILGEGSNILLTQDFPGLVIQNKIMGITELGDDADHFWIKVGAGENWHALVEHCIAKKFGGLENLSFIPGSVGAAPIQNIGAYGVELKDTLQTVDVLSIDHKTTDTIENADCGFGYRDSIFKHEMKDKLIVTHITLKLRKKPVFHVDYATLKETLKKRNIEQLSLRAISDAVIDIRQERLPDPKKIGNAGSFFKNPIVTEKIFKKLEKKFPNMPHVKLAIPSTNLIPEDEAVAIDLYQPKVKLQAAWLIEQCNWKGKRVGDVGVHEHQALVLVNHGGGTGIELKSLSEKISDSVDEKFGIRLIPEVNVYPV